MDANALWDELEQEGEEAVRRKWYQGLYGHPGSLKHQAVQGWLAHKDWQRSAKTEGANESAVLDDRLPLYRRARFDRDLEELANHAIRDGSSLALILVDPDKFKTVNDRHGHPAGDSVLLAFAERIARHVAQKGSAYRYGGDEMAVLLPNYTPDEAVALGETLRRQIEQTPLGPLRIEMTASFGVSCIPDHAHTAPALLESADKALYQAKKLGRNLVRVAGEPETVVQKSKPVERRQPSPTGLHDEEAEEIRRTYFTGYQPACPRDGANLRVYESHEIGRKTPNLLVQCPLCGLREKILGD